ncbi:MAG: HRDC domain-containing protein, partial [Verrucomicrobiota bacterium]
HHEGLFEALRQVRKSLADEKDVPPYVVFSDRTLRQMAACIPESSEELLRLHGVGQHRSEAYGSHFLEAIKAYVKNDPDVLQSRQPAPKVKATRPAPDVNRPLSETVLETLALEKSGLSLGEMASRREIGESTVVRHLCQIIEKGEEVDWRRHVPEAVENLARDLFAKHGMDALAPPVSASNGELSYNDAHLVRAIINREKAAT